jgi:hypothetical protein
VPIAGYAFCIALLTAGDYYNLTFVQLDLIDVGTSRLGMSGRSVSLIMALLALVALAASVLTGVSWTAVAGVATCVRRCACSPSSRPCLALTVVTAVPRADRARATARNAAGLRRVAR